MASQPAGQAGFGRHRERLARLRAEDDDSCQLCNEGPCSTAATSAQPCRQSGTCKCHGKCDRPHFLWSHNAGNSSLTAFSLVLHKSCPVVHSNNLPSFVAQSARRRAQGGAHLHGRFLGGQRRPATSRLGRGGRRRFGELQVSGLRGSAKRRAAWADLARWRGLRCCYGSHHGPAHAAHRLRRNHWAKVQGLGSTCLEQACWLPTTRSGQSRSRVTPHSATWRLGALPTFLKRGNDFADAFAKKGADTQVCFSGCQDSCGLCFLGQASATMGGRGPRLERLHGCHDKSEDTAPAGEDQAQAQGERGAGFRSGERLAFSRRSVTLFARQSSRPTHVQRAQLAVGASFRSWEQSVAQTRHHLRQIWGSVLGTCGRAVSQPPGASWRAVIAAQLEVLGVSKQTPSWLDSGGRSTTIPGRGNNAGGTTGILRGGTGSNRGGADRTKEATCCPAGSGAGTLGALV